jgi:hypothetical protein
MDGRDMGVRSDAVLRTAIPGRNEIVQKLEQILILAHAWPIAGPGMTDAGATFGF